MIKIEFSLAVALYLVFTACLLLALWLLFEKKKAYRPSSEKDYFWQCEICTYVYVDSVHNTISQCPRCGSYNKKSNEDTV